jgi:hypothetical protein
MEETGKKLIEEKIIGQERKGWQTTVMKIKEGFSLTTYYVSKGYVVTLYRGSA